MADEPGDITIEQYNQKVTEWGEHTGDKIRNVMRIVLRKGKGDLLRSFRLKTGKWYGEVDKLSYHFQRHGVFAHKGVGRGYQMVGGKVMRVSGSASNTFWKEYARQKNRSYAPKVLGGTLARVPVEWFNPPISANIDKLADLVTEMNADRAVNVSKIYIR